MFRHQGISTSTLTTSVRQCPSCSRPKSTQQSTSWGLKTFTAWLKERNKHKPQDKCSHDVLRTADKATLGYWFGRFVIEARRQNRQAYPLKTLHVLLMVIQQHIRAMKPNEPSQCSSYHRHISSKVRASLGQCRGWPLQQTRVNSLLRLPVVHKRLPYS